MSHTPGPWIATETKYRTLIYAEDGDRIGECQSLSAGDLDLILAAPDLLVALKALLSLHEDPMPYDAATTRAAARAAIAKAEGTE
jgi:hypothetical protein